MSKTETLIAGIKSLCPPRKQKTFLCGVFVGTRNGDILPVFEQKAILNHGYDILHVNIIALMATEKLVAVGSGQKFRRGALRPVFLCCGLNAGFAEHPFKGNDIILGNADGFGTPVFQKDRPRRGGAHFADGFLQCWYKMTLHLVLQHKIHMVCLVYFGGILQQWGSHRVSATSQAKAQCFLARSMDEGKVGNA